jgi:hypothetical protein
MARDLQWQQIAANARQNLPAFLRSIRGISFDFGGNRMGLDPCVGAFSDGKPVPTFPENALVSLLHGWSGRRPRCIHDMA